MVASNLQNLGQHDLIVARATAPGAGAVGIVRLDGEGVAELTRKMFVAAGKVAPDAEPRHAIYGQWRDPDSGDVIDDGLAIFFRAPNSFTGNDLVEFQCHGSPAVVRRLIGIAMKLGARAAAAGEFTRRAYLNGRLDLAQAEAIADLIRAETGASARAARAQLSGGLSAGVESVRQQLIALAAEIEARIDFPDEGLEEADLARLSHVFSEIEAGLNRMLETRGRGAILREGARVVLIGPPNAGKSSLLNALARSERAIVTPHPGTTRDTIECTVEIAGVAVTLVDTAGLREASEPVERIGIERSLRAMEGAAFALEVRDASGAIEPIAYPADAPAARIVVENKSDLAPQRAQRNEASDGIPCVRVSAKLGEGLDELEAALAKLILGASSVADEICINERHAILIERAMAALSEARAAWDDQAGGELVMVDLRAALNSLDEILGLAPNEAILDRVFEQFCIGK